MPLQRVKLKGDIKLKFRNVNKCIRLDLGGIRGRNTQMNSYGHFKH